MQYGDKKKTQPKTMKTTAIILAITATALFATQFIAAPQTDSDDMWTAWKMQYGKTYGTSTEENTRKAIFQQNVEIANNFNAAGNSATLGANQFADLTSTEFKAMYLGTTPKQTLSGTPFTTTVAAPASKDWRTTGAVSGVKNQGQCGSCWAFSTTGSVEGAQYLKNGTMKTYSEQDLVDCSTSYGNQGCNGGLMDQGFDYVKAHGLASETAYPYTAQDGSCKSKTRDQTIKDGDYTDITSESSLRSAVGTVGPVSVAVCAANSAWQLYTGGVLKASNCCSQLDHGVLAVAYDSNTWTIKNSWGTSWGESGYIRFQYGKNTCHLAESASSYVLN